MRALDTGTHTEPTFRGYLVDSIAGEEDATVLQTVSDAHRRPGQHAFDLNLVQITCVSTPTLACGLLGKRQYA